MTFPVAPLGTRTADASVAAAPEQAVQLLHDLVTAFNEHDADAFAGLFLQDAWFVNVLGHRWSGRGEIAEAHRFVFSTALAGSRVECTDVASRAVTDDVAIIEAVWISAEGADVRRGIMVLVVQRDETQRWAVLHCTNTDYPSEG